jgi:hypothetical protein
MIVVAKRRSRINPSPKRRSNKATKIEKTPEEVIQATCSEAEDIQVQFEVVTRQVETMREVEIR